MNNKNSIEGIGIVAINLSMHVTNGRLVPDLQQQDKLPSWDGHINIYSNNTGKKNDLRQVYVQVKGHSIDYSDKKNKKNAETIQERTQVEDLKNYLYNHGGAVYFSVYIDCEDPESWIIYYNTLTPVKLKKYLKGTSENGHKTITLKRFPKNTEQKLFILANFYENSKRQASFCDRGIIRMEDLENMEEITSITSSVIAHGFDHSIDGLIQAFLSNETYLYATIKGSDALLPIDTWCKLESMSYQRNILVTINGVEYYEDIRVGYTSEDKFISIGESIKIIFKPTANNLCTTSMSIRLSNSLRHRCLDMRFLLDAYKAGSFNIDEIPIIFNSTDIEREYFTDNRLRELEMYESIVHALDVLHIKDDFSIDILTNNDWTELINIAKHFDSSEKVNYNNKLLREELCDDNKIHKYVIKVQDITFYLFGRMHKNKMYLYDFVNLQGLLIIDAITNKTSAVHSILLDTDYQKISNISYDLLLSSYKYASKMGEICYERANYNVLHLLSAYDETHNPEMLNAAKELTLWIIAEKQTVLQEDILRVNLLQITKRERLLNEEEETQLAEIVDTNDNIMLKVAACLLLDNMAMAKRYYDKLGDEDKENMKSWPIYKFWK